jgi:hypothetical protein
MINYDDIDFDFFARSEVAGILEKCNIQVYHPDQCTWNTDQYQALVDSWDDIERCEKQIIASGLITDIPDILRDGDILEKAFDICFADEYSSCCSCGKLIKTSPSYYGNLPEYLYTDCEILCADCYTDDDIIGLYLNDADKAVNPRQLRKSLKKHGFICYRDNLESGFHPGQTDNPHKISQELEAEIPGAEWIFCIDGAGQFDIHFSLWYRLEVEE